jgi:hypothetical protein
MNEISRTIFRLSFGVLTFAVRGNQDSIVQRQIETIGLRQWLSLVATWILEAIYSETAQFRDFVVVTAAPLFEAGDSKNSHTNTDFSFLDRVRRELGEISLIRARL